jgi:hypothetical protein
LADGTVGVLQASGADRLIDNAVVTNGAGQTVYRQRVEVGALAGTWGYYAGASGTVNVSAGQRVIGIAAHSTLGGSMAINGGASVPIPAASGIAIEPFGNLVAPTMVFTSTDAYFVEVVS